MISNEYQNQFVPILSKKWKRNILERMGSVDK